MSYGPAYGGPSLLEEVPSNQRLAGAAALGVELTVMLILP